MTSTGEALPGPESAASPDTAVTAAVSPEAVLHAEEVVRARAFYRAVLVLLLLVVGFLPFLGGPGWLRALTAALVGAELLIALVILRLLRRDAAYTDRLAAFAGATSGVIGVGIIYYVGLFSAAAMVLNLGVYFFGLSQKRVAARVTFAVTTGLHVGLSLAVVTSVIPDLGLFSSAQVPAFSRAYQLVMSQAVFIATFFLARSSRRATVVAVDSVHRMSVEIARRSALLAEARGELDRALRAGEGRHTGVTVAGYTLGDIVGRGGMGEVYAATHVESGRAVAVKLLHPNLLEDPMHVKRFLREAQAEASVKSPHVAEVLDTGALPSGEPFLVMELLVGHDLGWHLRKSERLPLAAVLDLVEQVGRALAAVRDAGVVHRDLKPANLFLTDSIPPTWKVLDFGLSKIHGRSLVTKDLAVGTPSYMAPEQVKGGEVDHLADLYALAAIAYRAITGSPPFSGEQIANVLYDVLYSQPPSPAALVSLPVDVELVLAIGMAKDKRNRFMFVEELAGALRLAAEGELDGESRAKGWALLKAWPWGSSRSPRRAAAAPLPSTAKPAVTEVRLG